MAGKVGTVGAVGTVDDACKCKRYLTHVTARRKVDKKRVGGKGIGE